jgi:hypothetical protein
MSIVAYPAQSAQSALPPVPPALFALLAPHLAPLLAWLSDQYLARMRQQEADHPLCLLAQHLDLAPVIAQCADYYHSAGAGAPATYTVAQLVRAEIVRAYAGSCSSPALASHLRTNLVARWFVGLPLFGPAPSPDTLERFHAWLCEHHPEALFRHVLAFLDQVDPEDPATTPQTIDTFGMHAPSAAQSPAVVLMRLTARLAMSWLAVYPADRWPVLPADLDLAQLRTARAARSKARGQRQLAHAVTTAQQVIAAIEPLLRIAKDPLPDELPPLIAQIRQVIAAETSTDAHGKIVEKAHTDADSTYRIVSATDTEATFRKHTGHPAVLGYNAAISVTPTRIRAVVAPTGSTPDSETPELILQQQQHADQPLPAQLVMDRAGGHGKTRARVHAVSDGKTQMVARLPPTSSTDATRFGPADFRVHYDDDGTPTSARCPAGQTTTHLYRGGAGDGVRARFTVKEHCAECPLWQQCRPSDGKADSHRTVFLSDYHHYQRAAAAFNATEEGQTLLTNRWHVEPVISWLVNYQGCRRARRAGKAAVLGQLFQACAVRNLLWWHSRVKRGQAPPPPRAA